MSERGWPDRLFLKPHGRIVWIEFKDEGQVASKQQSRRHDELRALGHEVHVCDNIGQGYDILSC